MGGVCVCMCWNVQWVCCGVRSFHFAVVSEQDMILKKMVQILSQVHINIRNIHKNVIITNLDDCASFKKVYACQVFVIRFI